MTLVNLCTANSSSQFLTSARVVNDANAPGAILFEFSYLSSRTQLSSKTPGNMGFKKYLLSFWRSYNISRLVRELNISFLGRLHNSSVRDLTSVFCPFHLNFSLSMMSGVLLCLETQGTLEGSMEDEGTISFRYLHLSPELTMCVGRYAHSFVDGTHGLWWSNFCTRTTVPWL